MRKAFRRDRRRNRRAAVLPLISKTGGERLNFLALCGKGRMGSFSIQLLVGRLNKTIEMWRIRHR